MSDKIVIHGFESHNRADMNLMLKVLIGSGKYVKSIQFVNGTIDGHEYEMLEVENEELTDLTFATHQLMKD